MQYPWEYALPVSHIISTRESYPQYPWVISSVPVRICSTCESYPQYPWVISSVPILTGTAYSLYKVVNAVRFVILTLHRVLDTKALMLAVLRWHKHIQLAKFLYSRPPFLYSRPWMRFYTGSFQKAGRERLHSHRGMEKSANWSRIGSKFGLYWKANQKLGWFANLPFHSRITEKAGPVQVHCPELLGFYGYTQVHFTCWAGYSLQVYKRNSLFVPCFFDF